MNFEGWQTRYAPSTRDIVSVVWVDAGFSSNEVFYEAPVGPNYKPGVLDEVVGFLVGETADFLILSSSYAPDNAFPSATDRKHRHIWNIPKVLVLRMSVLVREEAKAAETNGERKSQINAFVEKMNTDMANLVAIL